MQKNTNFRTIVFATVLGLCCSLSLVLVNMQTGSLREANERAEELRNYLFALDVPVSSEAGAEDLLKIFDESIRIKETGSLTFYQYYPEGDISGLPAAVAVPLSGPGLWGRIDGVLALEPDLTTIKGVRFYKQSETPGLGGEIGADWFQIQFKGKSILSQTGTPGFTIGKPGEVRDANSVDGISGATMTSDRVEDILADLADMIWKARSEYER
jgi:Na+-transporting NADH:ubiquinone oxidoreductase subunit C